MSKPEGRIRLKIRKMLETAGLSDIHIWVQQGDYRKATWDCAAWGIYFEKPGCKATFSAASWDTMTKCMRGFVLQFDEYGHYEISHTNSGAVEICEQKQYQ